MSFLICRVERESVSETSILILSLERENVVGAVDHAIIIPFEHVNYFSNLLSYKLQIQLIINY